MTPMNRGLLQLFGTIFGYVLFAIALWFIYEKLREYHFGDVTAELLSLPLWQVALAFAFMIMDYVTLTFYDVLAFQYIGKKLNYGKIAVASFIGHTFSINMNVLTGSSMRYRVYSRFSITLKDVTNIVVFCYIAFLLGFLLLAGIIFQIVPLVIPSQLQFTTLSLHTIGIVFILSVIAYVLINAVRTNTIVLWKWTIPPMSVMLSIKQIIVAAVDWLFGATALYFLLPPSAHVSYPLLLGVYLIAQLAGQISQAPAGLGVFEASALLMLSSFAPSDALIGSLLLYRLFYYFLPLAIATGLLGHEELHPHIVAANAGPVKRNRNA